MKRLKFLRVVAVTAVLSLVAMFSAGCRATIINNLFDRTWRLDFASCENTALVSYMFRDVELVVSKTKVDISAAFTDEFVASGYTCTFKAGSFEIKDIVSGEFDEISVAYSDNALEYERVQNLLCRNGSIYSEYFSIQDKDGKYLQDIDFSTEFRLCFTKSGSPSVGGGDLEKPGPKSDEIKTAYTDAGYIADVGENDLDESLAATVTQLKMLYAAMGYELSVIGKNVDGTGAEDMELYMLFSAPTANDAAELETALSGAYRCARSGKFVIAFILPIGTPNFEPFEQAVN